MAGRYAVMTCAADHDRACPSVAKRYPVTPDGRYFVVRGRLWRTSDPSLPQDRRDLLVGDLMQARRDVGGARRRGDRAAESEARARVDTAKRALGERGPVWWTDGTPDLNRRAVRGTDYARWYDSLDDAERPR